MKKVVAAVAFLTLSSPALADVVTIAQTAFLHQEGNDPIRDNRPISFDPFDQTMGLLTEATLRITASYTPRFFNVPPVADTLLQSGVCLTDHLTFNACITVPDQGSYLGGGFSGFYVGAPVTLDRTLDVTADVLRATDEFSLSYTFGTTLPAGSAVDITGYLGSAILTYYDPPLPVPEPNPVIIMVLALLSAGLIRRRC